MLNCCNKDIKSGELWILKDIKDFTARKLYTAKCPICKDDVVLLIETRICDNQVFINNLTKIEAVKTLYREKKRRLQLIPNIKQDYLSGWLYGENVQIRNKKGQVTQIRQYSCNYSTGKRNLEKVINSSE